MKRLVGDEHRWQAGEWQTGRESWQRNRLISTSWAEDGEVRS